MDIEHDEVFSMQPKARTVMVIAPPVWEQMQADLAAARAEVERLTAERDYWAGTAQEVTRDAARSHAEVERLRAARPDEVLVAFARRLQATTGYWLNRPGLFGDDDCMRLHKLNLQRWHDRLRDLLAALSPKEPEGGARGE